MALLAFGLKPVSREPSAFRRRCCFARPRTEVKLPAMDLRSGWTAVERT